MMGRDADIERAQRIVRERFGEGRTPSEELIRERGEEAEREIPEEEWLRALSFNPAFSFLDDPEEDVYGPEGGEPWKEGP